MNLLGSGISGDIEVFGVSAQQQVAHSAADKIGLVTLVAQARHDLQGAVTDILAGDTVLIPGDNVQAIIGLWRWFDCGAVYHRSACMVVAAGGSSLAGKGPRMKGKTEFSPSRSHVRSYCYF